MARRRASVGTFIAEKIGALIGLIYGFIILSLAFLYFGRKKGTLFEPKESELQHRKEVSRKLWSLEDSPERPFKHNFITLQTGVQLHYISPKQSPASAPTLVVFIHGFPDSCLIWAEKLKCFKSQNVKAVALDLPGCGGSDGLDSYSADRMLNAITEAIVLLRQKYLRPSREADGRCIVVGHDWGGICSMRLATDTEGLFNHLIAMNSCLPEHIEANATARVSRAGQRIGSWRKNPLTILPLVEAGEQIWPIFAQIWKFGYQFMVRLPFPLARTAPGLSASLIRLCHIMSYGSRGGKPTDEFLALSWTTSVGPSTSEVRTSTPEGQRYGVSVCQRASANPPGDWDHRTRLYREGLAMDSWKPSASVAAYAAPRKQQQNRPQSPSSPSSPSLDKQQNQKPNGISNHSTTTANGINAKNIRFTCPVNIIYGMNDEALDPRICLEGIEDFFHAGEQRDIRDRILRLPRTGHWSPIDQAGSAALDSVILPLLGNSY